MNKIYLKARAKINLTLNVLDKRPDNYHNIESVFQKISLYDELFIEKNSSNTLILKSNWNELENENNILAHYKTTGKEIIDKLGKDIGGFVSGIGTGGTLMGIAKRLKEVNKNVKIHALEPDKMPLISQNRIIGEHKIEGIGDDFIPKLVNVKNIDKVILVNDEDAINMSRKIALDLGIGVGISSGANFIASVLAKQEIKGKIVTVFPDDNKKYLSTSLSLGIDDNDEYYSNKIKLIDYEII